jgi:hypothetical protein
LVLAEIRGIGWPELIVVLGGQIQRVLRDIDRIAIVGRVGSIAAQRVVQGQGARLAAIVTETRQNPPIVAPRRRRPQRNRAVAEVRPRQVHAAEPQHVGRLRVVDVDRPNQPVAVRSDVADFDRTARVQLVLHPRVPLLNPRRLEIVAVPNQVEYVPPAICIPGRARRS